MIKQLNETTRPIKGLVHPKMKILSVFTHPHVVPNLYVFIFLTSLIILPLLFLDLKCSLFAPWFWPSWHAVSD